MASDDQFQLAVVPASTTTVRSETNTGSKRQRAPPIGMRTRLLPDDGHQWHKYGHKTLVDSSFSRAYYRCAMRLSGCPVKKTVDFPLENGSELRITYDGQHNHEPCTPMFTASTVVVCHKNAAAEQRRETLLPTSAGREGTNEHVDAQEQGDGLGRSTAMMVVGGPAASSPPAARHFTWHGCIPDASSNWSAHVEAHNSMVLSPAPRDCLSPAHGNCLSKATTAETAENVTLLCPTAARNGACCPASWGAHPASSPGPPAHASTVEACCGSSPHPPIGSLSFPAHAQVSRHPPFVGRDVGVPLDAGLGPGAAGAELQGHKGPLCLLEAKSTSPVESSRGCMVLKDQGRQHQSSPSWAYVGTQNSGVPHRALPENAAGWSQGAPVATLTPDAKKPRRAESHAHAGILQQSASQLPSSPAVKQELENARPDDDFHTRQQCQNEAECAQGQEQESVRPCLEKPSIRSHGHSRSLSFGCGSAAEGNQTHAMRLTRPFSRSCLAGPGSNSSNAAHKFAEGFNQTPWAQHTSKLTYDGGRDSEACMNSRAAVQGIKPVLSPMYKSTSGEVDLELRL